MPIFCFALSFFFLSLTANTAETEFEKLLEKNPAYKAVIKQIETPTSDPVQKKEYDKLNDAIDKYIEEKKNPKQAAKLDLVDQARLDMKDCQTCENYLNLSGDVNKILSRLKVDDDVISSNEKILQLNKLQYLYYVVKHENGQGGIHCQKYGKLNNIYQQKFDGSFAIKAEELLDIPNINEVQYIPQGGKEVVYLYRGTGELENKIVEVHILEDKTAFIRYYEYTPSSAELLFKTNVNSKVEKALGELIKPETAKTKGDNYLEMGLDLKTRDKVIPTDVEVLKAQTKTDLSENLVLGTKTNLAFNEQKTEVSLSDKKGDDWLKVKAKIKTDGKSEFVTVVPMSLSIDESSKLKLGGSVKSEVNLVKGTGVADQSHTVNMGLTDHNNKYLDIEVYQKPRDKYQKVSISNNTKLGDAGDVSLSYSQDSNGAKTYAIGKNSNLGSYGTLKTEFGSASDNKKFISAQHEVAIGKTSTLSIGAKVGEGKQVTTMFQFQSKF